MQTQVYQIRAITNLHAGSGDADYGIVDKLVQRDPISRYPCIHMSSIKGALREFFTKNNVADDIISQLFGSNPKESTKVQQGKLRFISADILALPRPSEEETKAYELCYVGQDIANWLNKVKLFNNSINIQLQDNNWQDINTQAFKTISEELPVVARNYLDNGESQNLWYEEFVPRESVFGLVVQASTEDLSIFNKIVNNKVIQIGGNATVGYGYCLFTSIVKQS